MTTIILDSNSGAEALANKERFLLMEKAYYNGDLKIWEDGGHSWLQVPLAIVKGLDISSYSYQDKYNAYLEEDLDMGVLAKAVPLFTWWNLIPLQYENESRVRKMKRYRKQK